MSQHPSGFVSFSPVEHAPGASLELKRAAALPAPLRELEERLGLDATARRAFVELATRMLLGDISQKRSRTTLIKARAFFKGLSFKTPAPIPTGQAKLKIPLPKATTAERWRYAMGLAGWRARLAAQLGPQWADHISALLSALEQRRWQDALALALPLDANTTIPLFERQQLAPPPLMEGAQLALRRPPGAMIAVSAPESLGRRLYRHYRLAAQALEAQGQHDAVAFVLLELLREPALAAEHMTRQGRWAEAAKIAQANQLDPVWVVTLWCRAGELDRADEVARQHRAFVPALASLRALGLKTQVQALMMRWVDALLDGGDLFGALWASMLAPQPARDKLTWQLEPLSQAPEPWQSVGQLYASLLDPEAEQAQALYLRIKDASIEELELWAQLLRAVPKRNVPPLMFASWLARSLLVAWPRPTLMQVELAWNIAMRGADRALERELKLLRRAQLRQQAKGHHTTSGAPAPPPAAPPMAPLPVAPPGPPAAPAHSGSPAKRTDLGLAPILDMALLAHGHMALALGELGVAWLSPQGKTLGISRHPTHHLVVAEHGQRLITLQALKQGRFALGQAQVITRQWSPWCVLAMTDWANSYDGHQWVVMTPQQLVALDVLADSPTTTWRSGPLHGKPLALAQESQFLTLLQESSSGHLESMAWALPSMSLVERATWQPGKRDIITISADGLLIVKDERGRLLAHAPQGQKLPLPLSEVAGQLVEVVAGSTWIAGIFERDEQWWVEYAARYMSKPMGKHCLGPALTQGQRCRLRLSQDQLLVFDDAGRFMVIPLAGAHEQPLRACFSEP